MTVIIKIEIVSFLQGSSCVSCQTDNECSEGGGSSSEYVRLSTFNLNLRRK